MMTDNGILARCEYLFSQNKWISPTNVKSLIHFAKLQKAELKRLKAENERLRLELKNGGGSFIAFQEIIEKSECRIKTEAMEDLAVKIKKELLNEAKNRKPCEECQRDMAILEFMELIDRVLRETIEE